MQLYSFNPEDVKHVVKANPFAISCDEKGNYLTTPENLRPLAHSLGYIQNRNLPDGEQEPSSGQITATMELLKQYFNHVNREKIEPSWRAFNQFHQLDIEFPVGGLES